MDERLVERAVAGIRAGRPVVLPTDTVYGLCASPYEAEPMRRMYRLKGREEAQPTAVIAADLGSLFELVPELRGDLGRLAATLLPGPLTLVLPNLARRFPWLTGTSPDTIGVRVPELRGAARAIVKQVGAVAATSANLAGGPDPRRLDDVPEQIRSGCAALVDGGELPGVPSTVVDLTGSEPRVLREGAVPTNDVLERLGHPVG